MFVIYFVTLVTNFKFYVDIPDFQIQMCQSKSEIQQSFAPII
jgi:hypothetical protein